MGGAGGGVGAFLVGAVAVFLMMGGLGEGQERCPDGSDEMCIEYPEHGSGAVVVLTALDPEGEDVEWDLRDDDSTNSPDFMDFEINDGRRSRRRRTSKTRWTKTQTTCTW